MPMRRPAVEKLRNFLTMTALGLHHAKIRGRKPMAKLDDVERGDRVRIADAWLPLAVLAFVLLLGVVGLYVVDRGP